MCTVIKGDCESRNGTERNGMEKAGTERNGKKLSKNYASERVWSGSRVSTPDYRSTRVPPTSVCVLAD